MKYEYSKLIGIETLQGIKLAEKYKAKGWQIVNSSIFSIQFRVKIMPIENVKKGDYFRIKGQTAVYIQEGYCRSNKKYSGRAWNDISKYKHLNKGTLVEVDFDF